MGDQVLNIISWRCSSCGEVVSCAGMHLSRPMYEGLPWLYISAGVAAMGVSYIIGDGHAVGLLVGLAGLAALLFGVVVLLRRRDYRQLRAQYGRPDLTQRQDQD